MTNKTQQPPIETIAYGPIRGKIWERNGKYGMYYTASISKTYRSDSGEFGNTSSFGSDDLLTLAKIAGELHTRIHRFERAEFDRRNAEKTEQDA